MTDGHAGGDRVQARENGAGAYALEIRARGHLMHADEPVEVGGADTGPSPYELLAAALASCTAMTLRMYANRKGWRLGRIDVAVHHAKIHAEDCADCETRHGRVDSFERVIEVEGECDAEVHSKLLEIADKCPVHRTLHSDVRVVTRLADGA